MKPKKITKRMIALLLALIMTVMCCACSGGGNTPTGDGGNAGTSGGNTHTDGGKGKTTEAHRPEDNSTGAPASGNETPEKTIKLEKCESTGEVGFDKIAIKNRVYDERNEGALFPFEYNGKFGFINDKGEIVVENKYNLVVPFSEGKAIVRDDGCWHIIDSEGNTLFSSEMKQEYIGASIYPMRFFNGIANIQFCDINKYPYNTEVMIVDDKNNITSLSFPMEIGNVHPVITQENKFLIAENVNSASGGKIAVCDLKGSVIFELNASYFSYIGENYFVVKIDGIEKIIDVFTGKTVLDNISGNISSCSDGLITINNYDKWGLIDIEGNELIKPKYAYLSAFSHGLGFALDFDGNGIIINKKGEVVAELPESIFGGDDDISVGAFTDSGFTLVTNDNGDGYIITESGEIIFSGEAKSFKYISASYVVYGSDLYKIIAE